MPRMNIPPDAAYTTIKTALTSLEFLASLIRKSNDVPADVIERYKGSITAMQNMVPSAECIISNCNKAKQIMINSEKHKVK